MSKVNLLFLILYSILFQYKTEAQHLWYQNETETENILFTHTQNGSFSVNESNPKKNSTNNNIVSSKFVRNANEDKGFAYFELSQPILTDVEYTISIKAYIDLTNLSSLNRLRVYLKNTTTGETIQKQQLFTVGQEWQEFSFVFNLGDLPVDGFKNGGYNQMYIGYGNGQQSTPAVTYYVDQISGSKQQQSTTNVLKGSWGGRLYVRGGEDLDTFVSPVISGGNGYDYIAGAQEIVRKYPTMGHVMTNATNNANAQLWTLRTNPNVDVVMGAPNSIVDEEFVPSLANEQIIIDVINTFKAANKKVILYLNSQSPGNRATPQGSIAWNNYVDTYFAGNGHEAWMNYCEGYIKRFTELGIDGYWIDSFGSYNINDSLKENDVPSTDTEKNEFVQMIRNIAPYVTITTNTSKDYFVDSNGRNLRVDSDEINSQGVEIDGDDSNYSIIKMTAVDPWSDYTSGHITPLATGAPPNSWAYEEFTVTDIEQSSTSSYNGSKQTIKHLFLPIRATWSGNNSDLLFDGEQAYRFVKRITDAGGSVTFSNTTADGTIQDGEISVLNFVDQQLAINAEASVYQRPFGAFLTGEDKTLSTTPNQLDDLSLIIYPNPVSSSFEISKSFSSVSVYSITGQKVLDFNINETKFDVSKLRTGLYLLKANDSNGNSKVIRFIKK